MYSMDGAVHELAHNTWKKENTMEIHGPHAVNRPHPLLETGSGRSRARGPEVYADSVDFSGDALALLSSVREQRLEQIREEIARGTYDSIERLAATVAILAERLNT